MKSWMLLFLSTLLTPASGAVAGHSATAVPAHRKAAGAREVIEKLAPGIWVIHQRTPFHLQPVGNVLVVEQSNGLILLDSGGSPGSARRIVSLIRSVTAKPVKAIAITHWHGDHSLGAATLMETWPRAKVMATAQTREHLLGVSMGRYPKGTPDPALTKQFLDGLTPFEESFAKSARDAALPPAVRAGYAMSVEDLALYRRDIVGMFLPAEIEVLQNDTVFADRRRPVWFRYLGRGNTDGDLIAWLPNQRIVATGDLVVSPIPFGFGSYPSSWEAVLGQIVALNPRLVVPGHGQVMRDASYVRLLRQMLGDLKGRMGEMDQAVQLENAKKNLAGAFLPYRRRFARSDPWLERWFVKYWQDPITEMLWKERRGIPIEQGKG